MTLVRHEDEIYLKIWQLVVIELEHVEKAILEPKQGTQLVLQADPSTLPLLDHFKSVWKWDWGKKPVFYFMQFYSTLKLEGFVNDRLLKIVISKSVLWIHQISFSSKTCSVFIMYFNIAVEQKLLIETGLNKLFFVLYPIKGKKRVITFLMLERCINI